MKENDNLDIMIKVFEQIINKLPGKAVNNMQKEIAILRELVMDQRQPCLMIIGRRGAGKSSLLNAIFGEKIASIGSVTAATRNAKWYIWKSTRGTLNLLDTRGLGDRTLPESQNYQNAAKDIYFAIDNVVPDALLFLCKAKEIDARISEDLANVKDVLNYIKKKKNFSPPVIGVVTQVDELDPLSERDPPYQKKMKNISVAVNTLKTAFKSEGIVSPEIFPTSSYTEFDNRGNIVYSKLWNIDTLVDYLIDILPREAKIQFARMVNVISAREKTCRILIHSTATLCSGIAAVPVPVADIFPITSLQIGLITSVGYVAGRSLTLENAREFITAAGFNIGSAFVFREASRALVKIVFPGYGSLISAGVAYAGTWAIGEAAIAYYIQGKDIKQAQKVLKDVFTRMKKNGDISKERKLSVYSLKNKLRALTLRLGIQG